MRRSALYSILGPLFFLFFVTDLCRVSRIMKLQLFTDDALLGKDHKHLIRGGLATAFDLAAFRLSMIAPVKKSVNHSRTVASMRETGQEQQHQEVRLRSDSTVRSEFAFGPVGHCFFCCNRFFWQ